MPFYEGNSVYYRNSDRDKIQKKSVMPLGNGKGTLECNGVRVPYAIDGEEFTVIFEHPRKGWDEAEIFWAGNGGNLESLDQFGRVQRVTGSGFEQDEIVLSITKWAEREKPKETSRVIFYQDA